MFIHIGLPKTATKSLQSMFAQHPHIDYINHYAFNTATKLLVSDANCIYSQENISLLSDDVFIRFRKQFGDVTILMFVRDQVDILPSLYVQDGSFYLESQHDHEWNEWLDLVLTTENRVRRMLEYQKRIDVIAKLFPLQVYFYEDLRDRPEETIAELAKNTNILPDLAVAIFKTIWLNRTSDKPKMNIKQAQQVREVFGVYPWC